MGNLGMPELIVILVLALLLFGPKKLPELGKQIGKGLGEFRRASNDLKRTLEDEVEKATRVDESRPSPSEGQPRVEGESAAGKPSVPGSNHPA